MFVERLSDTAKVYDKLNSIHLRERMIKDLTLIVKNYDNAVALGGTFERKPDTND